jgi:dethiobiotin synthetase
MTRAFFVTGTDTGVGKTTATLTLIAACNSRGLRTAALKPVATGCRATPPGLRNDDAEQLRNLATVPLAYDVINPYAFEPPIAPHIAAKLAQRAIDLNYIDAAFAQAAALADVVFVEGVGGWQVPLNERQTVADLAQALGIPVVLVVGLRLGCLNHALLTAESIERRGIALAGWIANHCDDAFTYATENIATLREKIPAPLLGEIPWLRPFGARVAAAHLDLGTLLS